MPAGEGIALGGDVHGVRIFVDQPEQFHVIAGYKIRTQTQNEVFDHGVPDVCHQHIQADILAEFLVESPIQKAHNANEQNLLAERGQIGKQPEADAGIPDVRLQPLHESHFPVKKEDDTYCLSHNN